MVNQYDNVTIRDASGNISGYQNVATGAITGGATSPLYNQLVAQAAAQQYLTVGSGGTYQQSIPYTQTINPAAYGNTALGIAQRVGAGGGVVDPTFKPLLQQQYGVSLPNSMLPVDSQGNVVSGRNTLPVNDLSSNAPTRIQNLQPYTPVEVQALSNAQLRPGYTPLNQLGDTRTQTALKMNAAAALFGFDVPSQETMAGRILESQQSAAVLTPGTRDDRFYGNALQKWGENFVETSASYHSLGMKSGVPIPANRFEYQGDLATEFLKGAPMKSSEWFSPVSGEMSKSLPKGGVGLQQYEWNAAMGSKEVLSFRGAVDKLNNAEGQYGAYGDLWGAPAKGSVTKSSSSAMPPSVLGSSALVSSTITPSSWEGAGGEIVIPYTYRLDMTPTMMSEQPKPKTLSDSILGIFGWGGASGLEQTSATTPSGSPTLEKASIPTYPSTYTPISVNAPSTGLPAGVTFNGELTLSKASAPKSAYEQFNDLGENAKGWVGGFARSIGDIGGIDIVGGVSSLPVIKQITPLGIVVNSPGAQKTESAFTGKIYPYGEFSKWSEGAGKLAQGIVGITSEQMSTRSDQFKVEAEQKWEKGDYVGSTISGIQTFGMSAGASGFENPGQIPTAVAQYYVGGALLKGYGAIVNPLTSNMAAKGVVANVAGGIVRNAPTIAIGTGIAGELTQGETRTYGLDSGGNPYLQKSEPSGWFTDWSGGNIAQKGGGMAPALTAMAGAWYLGGGVATNPLSRTTQPTTQPSGSPSVSKPTPTTPSGKYQTTPATGYQTTPVEPPISTRSSPSAPRSPTSPSSPTTTPQSSPMTPSKANMIPRSVFEEGSGSFKLVPEGAMIRPGEPYVSRGGAFRGEPTTGIKENVHYSPGMKYTGDKVVSSGNTKSILGNTIVPTSEFGTFAYPSGGMSTVGSNGIGMSVPRTPSVGVSVPRGAGVGAASPRSGVGMSVPRGNEIGTFTPRTPSVGMSQPRPNEIGTFTPKPRNEIGTFTPKGYDFWINPKPTGEIGKFIPDETPPPSKYIEEFIPDPNPKPPRYVEEIIIREEPPPPPPIERIKPEPRPIDPIGGGGLIIPPLGGGGGGGGGAAAAKPGRGSSFSAIYNYGQGIGDMFGSMRPLNFGKSAPAPRKKPRRK
jgi:hypothetical protein